MKKLTEANAPSTFIPTTQPVLVEGANGKPDVYAVEGIFGKIDARNENNRRYPESIWTKNLGESAPFRRRLTTRSVLGELEHPESGNTHLERVAMIIVDAWIEQLDEQKIAEKGLDTEEVKPGKYIMGRYETLNTPRGQILKALHEARVNIGISSRGRGDIRNVDGVDVVQDDYELDTWDAVYLPSVTEAKPKPMGEGKVSEAGDLGSALPSAASAEVTTPPAGEIDSDVTPGNPDPMAWKPEAEEIVRALEDMVDTGDELATMVPTLQRGINLIDQLASIDSEDAIKLKSQALTLIRVLTNKIMRREAGEPVPAGADSAPKGDADSKKKDKPVEKDKADGGDKEKKESLIEGDMKTLATSINTEYAKAPNKPESLSRTDLEGQLNKAGHEISDTNVNQLAMELRSQGLTVNPDQYESLTEASKEEIAALQDGSIVLVSSKQLIASLKDMVAEGEVGQSTKLIEFLEKQEDDVLVRISARGDRGCIVTVLEPAYGESQIFVKYKDVKSAETEKQEEAMNMTEMMAAVVTENDKLKKQVATTVPVERYNAAKKLIGRMAERLKEADGVPPVRYEAAKKLIAGFVERVKKLTQSNIHEKKRVEAATKLIHKLVNEGKAPASGTEYGGEGHKPSGVTYQGKAAAKAKKPAEGEEVDPSKVVEAKKVPDGIVSMAEAVVASATENARKRAADLKAEAVEPEPVKAITTESKDLRRRISASGKKSEATKVVESAPNLMTAVSKRFKS